ncbi:MAG: S8 family serine peptidase [Micromonosporaceae bacterium]
MSAGKSVGRARLRRPRVVGIAATAVVALGVAASGYAFGAVDPVGDDSDSTGTYIVQLAGDPVASYDGGVSGFDATKPEDGEKLDLRSADAKAYRGHLAKERKQVLATVPGAKKVYDYDVAFNGFSAKLTGAQATKLARTAGVLSVSKNEMHHVDTVSTPDFLGLTGRKGVWQRQYGGSARAGEGVIVGVVDSGVWPDAGSFGPLAEPRPDEDIIDAKWKGSCDSGSEEPVICNNKIIGAHYYHEGVTPIEDEFESPRDHGGHGSHTASTAAGNYGVEVTHNGANLGKVSGMAPAARLAIYKVCWTVAGPDGGCGTVDSVKAIDTAVAEGVDVINYSISGSTTSIVNPVEVAFYHAAKAGVFVAASAGNSGPGSTVAHNAPWQTTVAASTHNRAFKASTTLGNGKTYNGAGLGKALPSAPLVASTAVGKDGADPNQVKLCYPGTLDSAKATGKIVACPRGVIARTDKSAAVKEAGGLGVILYNVTPAADDIAADFHDIPTVHVKAADGVEVAAYAATPDASAALSAGARGSQTAPAMASFSSAGPAKAGDGDLLKPDITAPGVDVIAAVAPPGNHGHTYDSYQGTSMSSPHIAGLAALVVGKNPSWSPMAVKSALMTTAYQTDSTGAPIKRGAANATPHDFGAGHVSPSRSFNPGLVYDSGPADWIAYLCAIGQLDPAQAPCTGVAKIDPSDFNSPSIASGSLAGTQTITRTVTNVTKKAGFYRPRLQAPAGFTATVSPELLKVAPSKTATYKVTLTRTSAKFGDWSYGSLTWLDGKGHQVRSPIAVRPVALSAPAEAAATGASGSHELKLASGYDGTLKASVAGLVPATVTDLALKNPDGSPFDTANPAVRDQTGKVTVEVPAGTALARFATFNADYAEATDVDVFVYQKAADGKLTLVGASAGGDSDETVTLKAPKAGTYEVFVDLYSLPAGQTEATIKPHSWVVGADAGNATVDPASQQVTTGGAATVTLAWQGLTAGTRYLGVVTYNDGTADVGSTVVSVNA